MKLFIKTFIVFCIPFFFLIGLYVWCDPFKVIFHYDVYLSEAVMLNRGFVSTEVFLKNNHDHNFNSFIFGSSRSIAYTCKEWNKYLPGDCSVYSYGNWNESIEGILRKVQFIDSVGNKMKNAIIVIDTDNTFRKLKSTLNYDHYLISGKSFGQFHLIYFSNWVRSFRAILESVDYKLFKTKRSYMTDFVGMKISDIDPVNNDWFTNTEDEILRDSTAYYAQALNKFYLRTKIEAESEIQISPKDSILMQKINSIFKKQLTNVNIIIGPLYNQIKFNKKDLKVLQYIFGEKNVYDFSGINDITNSMYNYLDDASHYRNRTGDRILKIIYKLPALTTN
jgi:hypothetical protein